ncbi:MAG: hypothetical protein ACR2H2_10355 [Solirubrobacteraceae bacterium]
MTAGVHDPLRLVPRKRAAARKARRAAAALRARAAGHAIYLEDGRPG